jgi:hypothetical protein
MELILSVGVGECARRKLAPLIHYMRHSDVRRTKIAPDGARTLTDKDDARRFSITAL